MLGYPKRKGTWRLQYWGVVDERVYIRVSNYVGGPGDNNTGGLWMRGSCFGIQNVRGPGDNNTGSLRPRGSYSGIQLRRGIVKQ